ncbi:MAG: hypothetical protein U5R31_09650 [Acidimicrobiia bacterium]|nr:hypothetical protein [Acidimicrobiia bacterium]
MCDRSQGREVGIDLLTAQVDPGHLDAARLEPPADRGYADSRGRTGHHHRAHGRHPN